MSSNYIRECQSNLHPPEMVNDSLKFFRDLYLQRPDYYLSDSETLLVNLLFRYRNFELQSNVKIGDLEIIKCLPINVIAEIIYNINFDNTVIKPLVIQSTKQLIYALVCRLRIKLRLHSNFQIITLKSGGYRLVSKEI